MLDSQLHPMVTEIDYATVRCLDKVYSPNYGAGLTVCSLSYGRVPVEAVESGEAKPIAADLSADGRGFNSGAWHDGGNSDDAVYVERHDERGCYFHGWVDAHSRRLVQAG